MRTARVSRSLAAVIAFAAPLLVTSPLPAFAAGDSDPGTRMVVAIVTYNLPRQATPAEVRRVASRGAQKYVNLPGLLRKNYCLSEDGMRATGLYVWESKARAEAFYTAEWKEAVTRQYGVAPEIVYLHAPVMVDNAAGRIVVDAE